MMRRGRMTLFDACACFHCRRCFPSVLVHVFTWFIISKLTMWCWYFSPSDRTGKWLHQDHAGDMCFWNSMSCAICHREGMLLIWWCFIVLERIMWACWEHYRITNFYQGQGYSLPADVQYVDTRWEVPVVLPLHDCLAQELSLLCELDG